MAHYESAPCIGSDTCNVQDRQSITEGQRDASSARKRASDALLNSVSNQQDTLLSDADALAGLQQQASSAEGQMQAIQAANQLASAQTHQLLLISRVAEATTAQAHV